MVNNEVSIARCKVEQAGYDWIKSKYFMKETTDRAYGPEWFLVSRVMPGEEYVYETYDPLKQKQNLFRLFGAVPPDRSAILRFANEYGLIGVPSKLYRTHHKGSKKLIPITGEMFQDWTNAIQAMHWALKIWDWIERKQTSMLAHHIQKNQLTSSYEWLFVYKPGEPYDPRSLYSRPIRSTAQLKNPNDVSFAAMFLLQDWVNTKLKGTVTPRLVFQQNHKRMLLYNTPSSLLGAMWLQLAQTITGDKKHRQCKVCGEWFEISKDGRTKRSLFCSGACKSRDYRNKKAVADGLS